MTLQVKPPKPRKCVVCPTIFTPRNSMQKACGPACAVEVAVRARVKKEAHARKLERKADRVKRESLKTRRDYIKEAQVAFNAYVRERDFDKPCISCGVPLQAEAVGGGYDCGHYRSVGSAPHLRFHEHNAHGQCKKCNRYDSGRAVDYRIGLIARIGLPRVEALEADQARRVYAVDELRALKAHYQAKVRELRKERSE